ncbi:MAG: PD-(D/E)XK nuclease family protein [Cyanobacteria bacterium P01_E01_bin.6]
MPENLLPIISATSARHQSRSYFVDALGKRLPSVSTILNATKPAEDREALRQWRQRVGYTEANRIAGQASRRGTKTHSYLRNYLLGNDVDCPEAAQPYWHSLEPVLKHLDNIRLIEGAVFHYDLGYAGRIDCIASYRGVPCVVDWKTSDRPKETVQRLYDNPLQLAAYCGAANHVYSDHDIQLKEAVLINAVPGQEAEVFWFDADTLRGYWHQWTIRVQEFYRRVNRVYKETSN